MNTRLSECSKVPCEFSSYFFNLRQRLTDLWRKKVNKVSFPFRNTFSGGVKNHHERNNDRIHNHDLTIQMVRVHGHGPVKPDKNGKRNATNITARDQPIIIFEYL